MKKLTALLTAALIVAVILLPFGLACASSIDINRRGSISISFNDSEGKPIKNNGRVSLYRIAGAKIENGAISYEKTREFSSLSLNLYQLDSETAPSAILNYISSHTSTCKYMKSVAASSSVTFTNLPCGIYFVYQSSLPKNYKYYSMTSFLVYIPMQTAEGMVYDISAHPKMEESKTPPPPTKPPEGNLPQTGMDISPVIVLFSIGTVLIIVGFVLLLQRKKQ